MFFHVELQKNVLLPPRAFGPNLIKTVLQRLRQEVCATVALLQTAWLRSVRAVYEPYSRAMPRQVEGSCTGRHGYIVLVTTVSPGGIGPVRMRAALRRCAPPVCQFGTQHWPRVQATPTLRH